MGILWFFKIVLKIISPCAYLGMMLILYSYFMHNPKHILQSERQVSHFTGVHTHTQASINAIYTSNL